MINQTMLLTHTSPIIESPKNPVSNNAIRTKLSDQKTPSPDTIFELTEKVKKLETKFNEDIYDITAHTHPTSPSFNLLLINNPNLFPEKLCKKIKPFLFFPRATPPSPAPINQKNIKPLIHSKNSAFTPPQPKQQFYY